MALVAKYGAIEFDEDGLGTVFMLGDGSTETREERIARLEKLGMLDPGCASCVEFYEAEDPAMHFAPSHRSGARCRSGGRPHCTCDTCF